MATQEEIKLLIIQAEGIWAEVKALENKHAAKRLEYQEARAEIGRTVAAFKYNVSIGDIILAKINYGKKRGEEVTIKVDSFPYRILSTNDVSVDFEGYVLRKDGSVGQRRTSVYPENGFTVISKAESK